MMFSCKKKLSMIRSFTRVSHFQVIYPAERKLVYLNPFGELPGREKVMCSRWRYTYEGCDMFAGKCLIIIHSRKTYLSSSMYTYAIWFSKMVQLNETFTLFWLKQISGIMISCGPCGDTLVTVFTLVMKLQKVKRITSMYFQKILNEKIQQGLWWRSWYLGGHNDSTHQTDWFSFLRPLCCSGNYVCPSVCMYVTKLVLRLSGL